MSKFNWKDTAELIGISAIVLSLIFVGLELRQTQEALVASALQAQTELSLTEASSLYNSEFMPDIIAKIQAGENLEPAETVRFRSWVRAYHTGLELSVLQNAAGILNEDTLRRAERTLRRTFGAYSSSDLFLENWSTYADDYSQEYRNIVNSVISNLGSNQ